MEEQERFVLRNARHLAADYMVRSVRKGDTVEAHDVRFTVHAMDGHRVDKIKVEIINDSTHNK